MAESWSRLRGLDRLASLALVLEWSFGLRVIAADLVQWYAQRKGSLCIFPDTAIYWMLADAIRSGAPFEVDQWGVPHFSLRTPGYPIFLAACRMAFGDGVLAVRLVQAALGTWSVWLVHRMARRVAGPGEPGKTGWTTPLIAAALAAADPYIVTTSAFLLTEAVFIPLMLVGLWGLAEIWPPRGERPSPGWEFWALGTGAASGAAVLVRPSWLAFVPAMLGAWVALAGRGNRRSALKGSALVGLGLAVVMTPWWARNARVYGRFVPTALWGGASLYDGLNPRATGASDMRFMEAPDIWPLDEEAQDAELRARAVAFARDHPGRAARLSAVKLARFWSPWPNADTFRSPAVNAASALVVLPQFALLALGAWDRRRDARALVVLAGPLVYFCVLHMVFVSSMRYRIPGAVPAMGLAAIGLGRALGLTSAGRSLRSRA